MGLELISPLNECLSVASNIIPPQEQEKLDRKKKELCIPRPLQGLLEAEKELAGSDPTAAPSIPVVSNSPRLRPDPDCKVPYIKTWQ